MSLEDLNGALIALDVDGTILRSDSVLAPRTVEALDSARKLGATVTLATGRDWAAVRDLVATMPSVDYALCVNGTEVATADGAILHASELDIEVARSAVAALRAEVPGVAFGMGRDGALIGEPLIAQNLPPDVGHTNEVSDVTASFGPGMRDLVVFHPDYVEDLEGLHALCLRVLPVEGLEVTYSGLPMIGIVPPGSGKDAGLAWLANHLGIPNDQVVAFGDGLNDLGMLRWAGTGVAMGQAPAAVMKCADEVTASNDDDGVAQWLEERF